MSKWVRLEWDIVCEIIPDAAAVPSVAHWYGETFAAQCREAPDEVQLSWVYNPETDTYAPPEPEPIPEPEPDYKAFIAGVMEGFAE